MKSKSIFYIVFILWICCVFPVFAQNNKDGNREIPRRAFQDDNPAATKQAYPKDDPATRQIFPKDDPATRQVFPKDDPATRQVFPKDDPITGRRTSTNDDPITGRQAYDVETYATELTERANQRILLARSSADYQVTPGDVYTLGYAAGTTPVTYVIAVDASYRIRVSNLGIIDATGKTFLQLKNEVETIVANNYPLSGVQLVLTQPAVFRVYVNGEVYTAGEASAWALSRLSSLTGENLTAYASIRDITIKSTNGQIRTYDLYKARRSGDISQDPYLRPGDVVTFNRIKRAVTISGEVERPGKYQLLDGENIRELVENYGGGMTPVADRARTTLTRYVGSAEISGDVILLSEDELAGGIALRHMDSVDIPLITARRPAVPVNRMERTITVSGAVRRPGVYELLPNENMKELIRAYADGFTPIADKTRVTLTRYVGGSEISGDKIYLTEQDIAGDYVLQHLDEISVPDITELRPAISVNRTERTITISGEVRRPGTYELMPNENLKELMEIYADGLTALADPTRIEMTRLVNSVDAAGDKIFLTKDDLLNNFKLEHFDSITVPQITELRAVLFVEGAIGVSITQELATTNRLTMQFTAGETYASLVRKNITWFSAVSDTQNAYIIRNGARIPINLNPMLYDASYRDDVVIQDEDTLVVPFRQYFVTVAGAVVRPGRYPFIPERNWEYYIGLAGGFVPERNSRDAVTIMDMNGNRMKKPDVITPETVITAKTNHALYFFNQYAPVITTLGSIISILLLAR